MPVTARLSQGFYEKFGDEIVNELVGLLTKWMPYTGRSSATSMN